MHTHVKMEIDVGHRIINECKPLYSVFHFISAKDKHGNLNEFSGYIKVDTDFKTSEDAMDRCCTGLSALAYI